MSDYVLTVGLEVHAELRTKTKLFCDSFNNPDEQTPNANICPICMGHPGTLPVINKEAVHHVLLIGTAVGGNLANYTEFDRKNYFYPDIPKGYQISQYKYPLVSGGELAGVKLTRIHLEEDTARSVHKGEHSLVDYNRAGVPLMELVTEPVIHDAETAGKFARELQLLLKTLGVADANMEKGEMRVEANISISKEGKLGTKVEVKNLNSFRSVERAIAYEAARQEELLEKGGNVIQETRGWDENKQQTFSQRLKESAQDYRYFPDPDIPSFSISDIEELREENLRSELPQLPEEKRAKLTSYGLKKDDVEMFISNQTLGNLFDAVINAANNEDEIIQKAANYIATDLAPQLGEDMTLRFGGKEVVVLMSMQQKGELSSRGVKDILAILVKEGGDPKAIAEKSGLTQKSNMEELTPIVKEIILENPSVVEDYKKGKDSALQFLVGQGMKKSRGAANPQVLRELLLKEI